MKKTKLVTLLAVLAFMASACGQSADTTTYRIAVDGKADDFNSSFLKFFPGEVTVRPGDEIVFKRAETGEVHTVTLGTEATPHTGTPGSLFFSGGFGGKPIPGSSMPCFLEEGTPRREGCSSEEQEPVPFDGTQSWHNSGGLLGDEEYTLTLGDDIEPGTYEFFCLIHADEMRGTINVVSAGEPADDPAEIEAEGQEQLDERINAFRPNVESPPSRPDGTVTAAIFSSDNLGASVPNWGLVFLPEEVDIRVGETVTWEVRGDHTISFNAPESARPFYVRASDNSIVENDLAATRTVHVNGWDGSGLLNSGLLSGFAPPARFKVTFTQPGTYTYFCLVHFGMEGKVKVSG